MRIETDRLILRDLEARDADDLAVLWADPEVTEFMGGPRDAGRARSSFLTLAREKEPPRWGLWPVVEKATGVLVGNCGLVEKEVEGRKEVELIMVFGRFYWGRGFATEMSLALRDYAFIRCGLTRLIALVDPRNKASARVVEKVGMRFEKNTVRSEGRVVRVYAVESQKLVHY
jgi:ribosomal-protein-alanine N-acetyltransferase